MTVGTPSRTAASNRAGAAAADIWVLETTGDQDVEPFGAEGTIGSVLRHYVPTAELTIVRDSSGKPRLANPRGLHFNLARDAGVTLVAVSVGAEVGIDVEKRVRRGLLSLPAHALNERERETLGRLPEAQQESAFLTYWVRKEAVLKAAGVGLGVEPQRIEVSAPTEEPVVRIVPETLGPVHLWTLVDLDVPGYVAAVAVRRPSAAVRMVECASVGPTP